MTVAATIVQHHDAKVVVEQGVQVLYHKWAAWLWLQGCGCSEQRTEEHLHETDQPYTVSTTLIARTTLFVNQPSAPLNT